MEVARVLRGVRIIRSLKQWVFGAVIMAGEHLVDFWILLFSKYNFRVKKNCVKMQ
jgi:hypothetical protein